MLEQFIGRLEINIADFIPQTQILGQRGGPPRRNITAVSVFDFDDSFASRRELFARWLANQKTLTQPKEIIATPARGLNRLFSKVRALLTV